MANATGVSSWGVRVYGGAAVLFGVIGLKWDDFAAVWQPVPADLAHRGLLAYVAAILFLGAGLAVQFRATRAWGALALGVLFVPYAGLWLKRVIAFPGMIGTWSGAGEEVALVTAGLLAYVQFGGVGRGWERGIAAASRVLFALSFASLALAHWIALKETAGFVPKWIPPGQKFWAIATGVFHMMAAVAIGSGVQGKLAARLLTAMIAVFGLTIWLPALLASPREHFVWCANAQNLGLLGAAWVVADWFGAEGRRG
ncbi:MAG TPA: hypothetical protein VMH31_01415 [Methylomirabilota bacterium]|nr:hypothetical protein [Methylomirabilota bacterium]